jgi:mono/diheme cytochrome c family protein
MKPRLLCYLQLLISSIALAQHARAEIADTAPAAYLILKRNCFECHGPLKQESDLRFDLPEAPAFRELLNPQNPETSLLIQRVSLPRDHSDRMPPNGPGLDRTEIDTLKSWVKEGGPWPTQEASQLHWAYLPPKIPNVPSSTNGPTVDAPSAIDVIVRKELAKLGLNPAPREKPERLIRRLYLDLIGLPPPPDVAQKFSKQPTDEEYARIVDTLLADPAFGERWAKPWLDAAHYADSHGFQRDDLRDIWPYRDWVIDAFNDDMPFDEFAIEQLAGDLLPNATEKQKIATGFLRCAPTNVEAGSLPEETRIEQIFDRVNTVGTLWLGTTLECCQCHDHKYDPFTMKDYYQIFACFNNTETEATLENDNIPSSIKFRGPYLEIDDADRTQKIASLMQQRDSLRQRLLDRRRNLLANPSDWYSELSKHASQVSEINTLNVLAFNSLGTTDNHTILDDGSVLLVGGDPPDVDTYDIMVGGATKPITALRLDALKHPSLPGEGPGRGDSVKTNFVLNEFTAEIVSIPAVPIPGSAQPAKKVKFKDASADHSQNNYPVKAAIDGKPKTGWAIGQQFDRDHHAIFYLAEPLTLSTDQALRIRLTQNFGSGRTIGRVRISAIHGDGGATPLPTELRALLSKPLNSLPNKEQERLVDFYQQSDASSKQLQKQIANLDSQITQLKPIQTLVAKELAEPRPTHIFLRGDYRQQGERVKPGLPKLFRESNVDEDSQPFNRLQLARWLVSANNPLASRVAVNRYWAELFGNGLVNTPEDFGLKGSLPSHPELLDWLTLYFEEHNRSLKQLLKVIVLSDTYRQSSVTHDAQMLADPENRWLARGPRFRLDAEIVRDNILSISGLLSRKAKGPPIYPQQPDGLWTKIGGQVYNYETSPAAEANRRSIYIVWKRASPYPSLMNFDATSRLVCSVKRSRTNTPLQALTLLNDPVYVAAAKSLAQRIIFEREGDSWDDKLQFAFWLTLSRPPSSMEQSRLRAFFDLALAEFPDSIPQDEKESKAWFDVATVLLNLHETITKE